MNQLNDLFESIVQSLGGHTTTDTDDEANTAIKDTDITADEPAEPADPVEGDATEAPTAYEPVEGGNGTAGDNGAGGDEATAAPGAGDAPGGDGNNEDSNDAAGGDGNNEDTNDQAPGEATDNQDAPAETKDAPADAATADAGTADAPKAAETKTKA